MATKAKAPKKTPVKSKSKAKAPTKKVVAASPLRRAVRWAATHKLVVALVAVILFGSVGAYVITSSKAATTALSAIGCEIRGRNGHYIDAGRNYYCEDTCRKTSFNGTTYSAGSLIKKDGKYAYCSNAISEEVSNTSCSNLKRQYVGDVGCARSWVQGDKTQPKAIQCIKDSFTYHVTSTSDYCSDPAAGTAGDWVWPVSPNRGVGNWGSGHYARDFDGETDDAVKAVDNGVVTWAGSIGGGCGSGLILRVAKPGGGNMYAVYEHIKNFPGKGTSVSKGQTIGKVAYVGSSSCWTGTHVHLGIQTQGDSVESHRSTWHEDPCKFLAGC